MSDNSRTIPFFVHEAEMSRHEACHKRDFIEKIILIILLVATNAAWLWYESQFEYSETTEEITQEVQQETDGGGDNMFIGGSYYGESKSENNYTEND